MRGNLHTCLNLSISSVFVGTYHEKNTWYGLFAVGKRSLGLLMLQFSLLIVASRLRAAECGRIMLARGYLSPEGVPVLVQHPDRRLPKGVSVSGGILELKLAQFQRDELKTVVHDVIGDISQFLKERNYKSSEQFDHFLEHIEMGISEILLNALRWGCAWGKQGDWIILYVEYEPNSRRLRILINDAGLGFDPEKNLYAYDGVGGNPVAHLEARKRRAGEEGDTEFAGGYGILLSRRVFADSLTYNRRGNEAVLEWDLAKRLDVSF